MWSLLSRRLGTARFLDAATRWSSSSTVQVSVRRRRRRRIWPFASLAIVGATGYAAYKLTPDWRSLVDPEHYYDDWRLRLYFSFPWNVVSRASGTLSTTEIPVWLRKPLFGLFARVYGCNLDEAVEPDIEKYETFAQFFNRTLRPQARPISPLSNLVSPVDGTVLRVGEVKSGRVEMVKGSDYDVHEFLGEKRQFDPSSRLYQVVLYLAPGDYHGFHSPTHWLASQAHYQPGLLLSVQPKVLDRVPHLLCLNERVTLSGGWRYGFFAMSAVAATNVGDINVEADPELKTNAAVRKSSTSPVTKQVHSVYSPGQKVGEFRLGSTVVLLFEAPPDVRFAVQAGNRLRFGEPLVDDSIL